MSFMSLSRIITLREALEEGCIDLMELSEIDEAFKELVASGFELRDLPENAMAADQLDELEEAVNPLERAVYDYIAEHFGESEANDPAYDLGSLCNFIESEFEVKEKL